MKKLLCCAATLFLAGCVTFHKGTPLEEYHPQKIGSVADSEAATIKVTDTLHISRVDGQAIVKNVWVGQAPDSILIAEGKHSLNVRRVGSSISIDIKELDVRKGHTYMVEYLERREKRREEHLTSIYYWVRDLGTGTVVYGKEVKPEQLGEEKIR